MNIPSTRGYIIDTGFLQSLAEESIIITWNKAMGIWKGLCATPPVMVLNNRLKTTAGRAWYDSRKIDLSTELFWEYMEHFVSDIIPHEACHLIANEIYKHQGHGPAWKETMVRMGCAPNTYHKLINTKHAARKNMVKV